jgi:hypothetical protein
VRAAFGRFTLCCCTLDSVNMMLNYCQLPKYVVFFVAGLVVSLIYLLLFRISIETVVTLHFGSIAIHEHEVSLVQSI